MDAEMFTVCVCVEGVVFCCSQQIKKHYSHIQLFVVTSGELCLGSTHPNLPQTSWSLTLPVPAGVWRRVCPTCNKKWFKHLPPLHVAAEWL